VSGVRVLVGSRKGAFILSSDERRQAWEVSGPHFCLGANLARMELQVALGTILSRLPRLRIAVPEDTLTWHEGTMMRGLAALPVAW